MKQKQLTATQIKAILQQLTEAHNTKVKQHQEAYRKAEKERQAEYRRIVTAKFLPTKCTDKEFKELISYICKHFDDDNNTPSWSINKLCGPLKIKHRTEYKAGGWRAEDHPMHKVLENVRFKLVMASVENYESFMKDALKQIDAMFKEDCERV